MFDGFLAGMFGTLTSMISVRNPTPVMYIASFLIGAVACRADYIFHGRIISWLRPRSVPHAG